MYDFETTLEKRPANGRKTEGKFKNGLMVDDTIDFFVDILGKNPTHVELSADERGDNHNILTVRIYTNPDVDTFAPESLAKATDIFIGVLGEATLSNMYASMEPLARAMSDELGGTAIRKLREAFKKIEEEWEAEEQS